MCTPIASTPNQLHACIQAEYSFILYTRLFLCSWNTYPSSFHLPVYHKQSFALIFIIMDHIEYPNWLTCRLWWGYGSEKPNKTSAYPHNMQTTQRMVPRLETNPHLWNCVCVCFHKQKLLRSLQFCSVVLKLSSFVVNVLPVVCFFFF